jgi:hypothetical protein
MKISNFVKRVSAPININNKKPHVWFSPQYPDQVDIKIYRRAYSHEYYLTVDENTFNDYFNSKTIITGPRKKWDKISPISSLKFVKTGFYTRRVIAGPFPSFTAAKLAYRILPENFNG